MKTFLLNLDKDVARLEHMTKVLGDFGIEFERVPGVYAKAMSKEDLKRHFRPIRSFIAQRERIQIGMIGCCLSHIKAYRRMIEENLPYALIFEDDVVLEPKFPELLKNAESFLDPSKPQVLLFSAWMDGREGEEVPDGIIEEDGFFCADAYCLTLPAAKLITRLNDPVITISDAFTRWHKRYGLELYRIYPTTARQDNDTFGSNINEEGPEKSMPSICRSLLRLLDRMLIALGM